MPAGHLKGTAQNNARFETTRWSLVFAAGEESTGASRRALEELCGLYWQPLYYFVRSRGRSVEESEDLLQGFFAHMLERDTLRKADPDRGRFRSYLLGCLTRYVSNEWGKTRAKKRGGDWSPIALDVGPTESAFALEPTDGLTPEKIFERRWATTLLELTMSQLRRQYDNGGRRSLFDKLEGHLTQESNQPTYREIAEELGMTTGSVKLSAHKMRRQYGGILRQEIAQTVATPEEVEQEIQDLFAAFDD